jgi:hypothetical protein
MINVVPAKEHPTAGGFASDHSDQVGSRPEIGSDLADSADSEEETYTFYPGMIGSQPPMAKEVSCLNVSGCPALASSVCDGTPGCVGFGLCPLYKNGMAAQLYDGSLSKAAVNIPWSLWMKKSATPGPPGPPSPPTQPFRVE